MSVLEGILDVGHLPTSQMKKPRPREMKAMGSWWRTEPVLEVRSPEHLLHSYRQNVGWLVGCLEIGSLQNEPYLCPLCCITNNPQILVTYHKCVILFCMTSKLWAKCSKPWAECRPMICLESSLRPRLRESLSRTSHTYSRAEKSPLKKTHIIKFKSSA